MTEHRYPSAEFPGPTPVRVWVPDDWSATTAAGAAMAFVAKETTAGVRTSLVVLVTRVSGDPTLDEVAASLRAQTGQLAGDATTVSSDVRTVAGRTAIRTVVRLPVPQRAVTLVQAQTVLALDPDTHGHREVVQAHFTCEATAWPVLERVLDTVLDSLTIG